MKVNKRVNKNFVFFCKSCKELKPLSDFYEYNYSRPEPIDLKILYKSKKHDGEY